MLVTLLIACSVMILAVVIHYEFLNRMAMLQSKHNFDHRAGIAVMLLGAIFAHVIEIWCFAFAYYILFSFDGVGELVSTVGAQMQPVPYGQIFGESFFNQILDYSYFSFTVYTTLGFGDMVPVGYARFMVGTESLVGLVLITWTASFLFMQMERNWRD